MKTYLGSGLAGGNYGVHKTKEPPFVCAMNAFGCGTSGSHELTSNCHDIILKWDNEMKISISLHSFMLLGCCSFLGLVLLFFAMILWGFNSALTVPALLAGMALLLLGGFLWAYKLPWHVALTLGGMTFAAAWFAGAYVPLLVSYKGEDMPGFVIHLLNVTLGVPGIALILAGIAGLFRRKDKGMAS